MARRSSTEVQHVTVHGHRRAYVRTGSGPVLLLLHGLGCDHTTWEPVLRTLARSHTVIAPDLLGHGASDKPRADYSVGGYANGMRDLLTVLGVESATVVGHSLGGGVAMQFAYQFPELTERLVLVSSGGLGPEVSAAIRAITVPGWEQAMGLLTTPGVRHAVGTTMRALARTGLRELRDLGAAADVYDTFRDPQARAAVRHVVRAVVDHRGQVITMADRAYLTEAMPICVVWGADDRVIPASHAETARALAPGARIEVLGNAGHFPHHDHPERFARIVRDFVRTTPASRHDPARWRRLLVDGPAVTPREAGSGEPPVAPVAPVPAAG